MENKEIFIYESSMYQISSPNFIELTSQETESQTLKQEISILKALPTDICLIIRIGKYDLSRALILDVTYEKGFVFVENQEFNVWGEGKTLDEAIKSFEDFFLYDFKSYRNILEKKMDFSARRQLKSYKEILNIP